MRRRQLPCRFHGLPEHRQVRAVHESLELRKESDGSGIAAERGEVGDQQIDGATPGRIWVYPVVLGRGKRLFEAGASPVALDLVETKRTSTGVAVNTYRPTGKPKFGSFALDA